MKTLILSMFFIILICVILYYYHSIEGMTNSNQPITITLFMAHWCPVCKSLEPNWDQIKADYTNRVINNHLIQFNTIDCSDNNTDTDAICKKYGIKGFPTIKAMINDQVINMNDNATIDTISSFIEETANNY